MVKKFKLEKTSWKFKLMLALGVCLTAVILMRLPASRAQREGEAVVSQPEIPVVEGKISRYANGVSKVEPQAFGITPPLREMPDVERTGRKPGERFVSRQERKEAERNKRHLEKGYSQKQIDLEELNRQNAKRIKKPLPGAGAGNGEFRDPLIRSERSNAPQVMPVPSLTFNGASQTDNAAVGIGQVLPPDVNGDVGPNHYVSSVNLVYKIFNKSGTVAAGPFATSTLFSGLPANDPCRTLNDGDPVVVYDSLADRWHISQFAVPGNPNNYQCVALSVTGDPTGAYYVWSYLYPDQIFNDYPKVGVWLDGYHMTFNQFNNAGTAFLGMGFLTQDRAKALAGDPTASVVFTNIATIDPNAGGGLPADIDGFLPPPTGMAEVIAEYRADEFGDTDSIRYYKWVPNFASPGSSTVTVLPDVALAPFDARSPTSTRSVIEQSGGANLDAIGDRLMHRFAYRNLGTQAAPVNSFVGNFTVNVSGVNPTTTATYQTGIRWFEMRRSSDTFSVFDQGTHTTGAINGSTGLNNWMGGIAQDNKGNIALGFSQSSSTQNADIKIAGRTNNVANSGTLNEGEALFFDALGSQTSTSARWGDYSAMNIDPIDDCTFWYTQEYYAATSSAGWSTRVGKFVFPSCTPAPKATIQGTITNCNTGAPLNLASVTATGGFNRLTGVPGNYSMTVAPGTYTVTATKTGGFSSGNGGTVTVANGGIATVNACLVPIAVVSSAAPQVVSESCSVANTSADPGEDLIFSLPLQNTGQASTVNLTATLQATGGVVNPGPAQNYGALAPGGAAVTRNFNFKVNPALACGANVTLTWVITDGATNYGNVTYTVSTGGAGTPATTSYTGPPVAIPDDDANGVSITLPVSGVTNPVGDLNFRFDALAGCDTTAGNTNASVTHTYLADLNFTLTSPAGTTVSLVSRRGGSGNNICTLLLDDDGGFPAISTLPTTGGVAGNYAPESPLSAFDGQNANGNWVLNVADVDAIITGTMNRFSLVITPKVCSATCVQGVESDTSPRPGGDGQIGQADVDAVQAFQVGLNLPYQSNEFQRADSAPIGTKGNGAITSIDVAQANAYRLGINPYQLTGGAAAPPQPPPTDENPPESNRSPLAPREVRVVNTNTSAGQNVTVPVQVDTFGDESVYGFSLTYDQTKLSNPVVTIGEAGGTLVSNTTQAGVVRVSVSYGAGTIPAGNNQTLVNIQFTVAPTAAGTTPLTFTNTPTALEVASAPNAPGGVQALTTTFAPNGAVIIGGPTATTTAVTGRVLTSAGRGISNAVVTMTDAQGNVRTTRSNAFGFYRFDGVAAGATYIFQVSAKRYTFSQTSQIRNVTEDVEDLNFVANGM